MSIGCILGCAGFGWEMGQRFYHAPADASGIQVTGIHNGQELLLILVGSSFCGAAQQKGFDRVFAQVTQQLRSEANRRHAIFGRIGVATDWEIPAGLAFLERFGPFDEVIVGRSWLNSGYDKYVRRVRGDDGIPEVVVISRRIVKQHTVISFSEESVLATVVGTQAIQGWLAAGAPLQPVSLSSVNGAVTQRAR